MPQNNTILYACIVRDETLLVQAKQSDELHESAVLDTARNLLNRPETLGWDSYTPWTGPYKGLRFHVYQQTNGRPRLWIFCCVHQCSKKQAQAFLEKIAAISEIFRETDETWRVGDHHACEELFQPILLQQMENIDDLVDDSDMSLQIIQNNRAIINEQREQEAQEQAMLRQMEEMNSRILQSQKSPKSPSKGITSIESAPTLEGSFDSDRLDDSYETSKTMLDDSFETTKSASSTEGGDTWEATDATESSFDSTENAFRQLEIDACRPKASGDDELSHEKGRLAAMAAAGVVGVAVAVLITAFDSRLV
jgi:hypothetical protein